MTLADLAGKVGVSSPHMSQVERGIKTLNSHLIERISRALNVPPQALIADSSSKEILEFAAKIEGLSEADRARVSAFVDALLASQETPRNS